MNRGTWWLICACLIFAGGCVAVAAYSFGMVGYLLWKG